MKKLWPVLSAVGCLALPGCGGSPATQDPPPIAPVAKPVAPVAAPTPVPVAAPPEMPSAPKPVEKEKVESAPADTAQAPSQMVSTFASQIRSTEGEDALRQLELDLRMKQYRYEELSGSANNSLNDARLYSQLEVMMKHLVVACEGKRVKSLYWEDSIENAEYVAGNIENSIRNGG